MAKDDRPYLSYLLRVWRESGKQGSRWRASLESSLTGVRTSFGDLEGLFAFLRRLARDEARCDQDPGGEEKGGTADWGARYSCDR